MLKADDKKPESTGSTAAVQGSTEYAALAGKVGKAVATLIGLGRKLV